MAELRVRPLTETDLDDVLEIERASFSSPWTRRHFRAELATQPYGFSFVLEESGRVLGYACCQIIDDELRIDNIALDPPRRREGLATRLLRWVLLAATRRGCTEATLEVRPSNTDALALYRRHGFRETGRRRGYYGDTGEDAILMSARLCPGAASEV